MIELDNLQIRYGNFCAVNGLSLIIEQGELFGFLGPNGAGKTTTIKALTGNVTPSGGEIRVNNFRLPRELHQVKSIFGYVPDIDNHILEFTGRENLQLFARLYGVEQSETDRVLNMLELDKAANVPVRAYSKGMKKKLMIAREILHRPRVIYCDEPTANLDAHSTEHVRNLLVNLSREGVTVFLTTHNMHEVEKICDRVAIISRGQLIECDTPTQFITRHAKRRMDIQYDIDGVMHRESLDLDNREELDRLSNLIRNEKTIRVHSQEFHFEDVFLKLTGDRFR